MNQIALCGDIRGLNPDLPWIEIAVMRHELIHEYFGVNLEIVWETARKDLAPLQAAIRQILKGFV